jgi:hypothetical protein
MEIPFEVFSFRETPLSSLFSEKTEADLEFIQEKPHTSYLQGYLKKLDSQTIVVENNYVDRDFLDDFANYYVLCFTSYLRQCKRLHFFSENFDADKFSALLTGDTNESSLNAKKIQDSYLGFIVLKPLPETVIGRTCLKTYDKYDVDEPSRTRYFPGVRPYHLCLFGIPLTVESLAFQEQDKAVAACATSALWSAFQSTGFQFQHQIPSPIEITKVATSGISVPTKAFPKRELTFPQVALAIKQVGLVPLLLEFESLNVLKRYLYAYLRGKFPVILGFSLLHIRDLDSKNNLNSDKNTGNHAVVITGYSLISPSATSTLNSSEENIDLLLRADKIERIYVHDDQVGPFARMIFHDGTIEDKSALLPEETQEPHNSKKKLVPFKSTISTSWGGENTYRALPYAIMIPLYHKVRVPYTVIEAIIRRFDSIIKEIGINSDEIREIEINSDEICIYGKKDEPPDEVKAESDFFKQQWEWDIYLTSLTAFKQDIFEQRGINGNLKQEILLECMPRFIWCAGAYIGESKLIEFIFDATDIEQGNFFVRAIEYDSKVSGLLKEITKTKRFKKEFRTATEKGILTWFRKTGLPE